MDEPLKNRLTEDSTLSHFEPMSERYKITFAEIGGLEKLKREANLKIIQPFKNPELFKRFKKQAGGGILLYGPPGCGKSYFARAIAGECGATFFNVGIDQILDMYVGNSEKNLKHLFQSARNVKPAILFVDEIDALGRRRDLLRHTNMTSTINAFLAELDGVESDNSDLLIIGATNAPWDVDSAFRRPGRFDRTLFIPPPDEHAREEIFRLLLEGIPSQNLHLSGLAKLTPHFSGADLKGVVDRAGEAVIEEILEGEEGRVLLQDDLLKEISDSKPTTMEWFESAKNVVEYANENGIYDELADYLRHHLGSKGSKMGFLR